MTAMKFFFADSHDFIDPGYDFENDAFSDGRRVHHDDVYPHEYFARAPYDGMLVSRAVVGDGQIHGKYSTAQVFRFRRDGASKFLRFNGPIFGDCGAFSYLKLPEPPYTIPEIIDYYAECGFTHAVSIDHVILGFNEDLDAPSLFNASITIPAEWTRRYELTLKLADEFLKSCHRRDVPFQPIGIAQGWSPASYREAVRRLVDMGYDYVAIGGMVPLKVAHIHRILTAVREVAPPSVRLHLFGFTKADNLSEFVQYGIESFDSTSPMIRAFKDSKRNYLSSDGWYTALRVPQADESRLFKGDILAGLKTQRELRSSEEAALTSLRAFANRDLPLDETLEALANYGKHYNNRIPALDYQRTLDARPWEKCDCKVCTESGIEALIFRGSNRNRRRGFHNLWEFHRQLSALRERTQASVATN